MEEGNSRFLESVLAEVLAHLEPPKDGRIRHDLSPASLRKTTDLDLPLVGAGLDRVLDDIRTYLSQAVRTDQPGFMNPLWGGLTLKVWPVNWLQRPRTLRCTPTKSHRWRA